MTSRPKFGLGIKSGEDGWSPADLSQCGGGLEAQLPRGADNRVGNFVGLEMHPHVFDRIEFRRIRRQAFQDDPSLGGGHVIAHLGAAMNGRPVPKNQQPAIDVPLQVLEELNDLGAFDAALMDLEVEPPQSQSSKNGQTLSVEALL